MSTYLFQEARIGDTVEINGHLLMVKEQKGHCPDCFFFKRSSCSGIACTGYERTDGNSVFYKELKKKRIMKKKKTFKKLSAKELKEVNIMAENCINLLEAWNKVTTEMEISTIEVIRTAQMMMVYALIDSGVPEEVNLDLIGRASKDMLKLYRILTDEKTYNRKKTWL